MLLIYLLTPLSPFTFSSPTTKGEHALRNQNILCGHNYIKPIQVVPKTRHLINPVECNSKNHWQLI